MTSWQGQFLNELREHTFSGSTNEDPNEHIERVLEIVDLFTTPDVTHDQLMLCVFSITLTGAASRWLRNEPAGSITTWEILKGKFLSKNCPPSCTAKKMEEINNFHQEPDETLYQAWERFKEILLRCPQNYLTSMQEVILFYKGLDVPTRQIIDSKGVEEGKTLENAYYTQFGVPFPQAGRYRAAALGFYQRDNGNTSYQERRQTMEESLNKFMKLRSFNQSIRDSNWENEQENGYDEKEVLKELKKLKVSSIVAATSLRRLLKENSRIDEEFKVTMKVHCLIILKDALPLKEKDPRSFTLPCNINNICFDKALADLGASVSVMPYSTFTNLGLGKLAPTKLIIELADKTVKRPKGIAENVLVGIDKFVFLVVFIILDMPEDIKILLIFGRPFLSTTHAKIDVFKRKIDLRIRNHKIVFKSDSPTSNIIKKVYMFGLRELMELDLEARLIGDPEFRNFLELNDLDEPLEINDHEIEDLDPEIDDGEIIDEPKIDVVKIRHDDEIVEKIDEYPSFYDYDRKIHINCAYNLQFSCMIGYEHVNANFFPVLSINVMSKSFYNSIMKEKIKYKGKTVLGVFMNVPIFVGNFLIVTDFAIVENINAYRDKNMGNVIVGKPFCRVACVEAKRLNGFITIHDGNDSATYQMARSHPSFKHLSNEQCNKIWPLLQVSVRDILEGNWHRYQKLKVSSKES
ncbi:putative reverse transcriptase domain-containing protein [Tanacetum coccineum]